MITWMRFKLTTNSTFDGYICYCESKISVDALIWVAQSELIKFYAHNLCDSFLKAFNDIQLKNEYKNFGRRKT